MFLYRSSDGTSTLFFQSVQLRWNYGVDGLADDVPDLEVRVLGIEMVYVPQGAYAADSGGTGTNEFTLTTINTADATVAPSGMGSLGGQAGGYPTGQTTPDNASWPNGYAAFYIMKYEISQGQYAEFLNLLTSTQATTRNLGVFPERFTITGSHPTFTASAPDRACNHLGWADGAAYADWAGLRPMTELEYEKASRGTVAPVADEYAWGSTSLHAAPYTITDDGQPNSTVNAGSSTGNASWFMTIRTADIHGPLRVGIFAASIGTPTREEAGATFYGVMEMSGNVYERAVTIGDDILSGSPMGRAYTGTHGDGVLTSSGEADAGTWPGAEAIGTGFRGGTYFDFPGSLQLRVSDRNRAASANTFRDLSPGFRAVRSAP